jgi:hypothetical protein
MNFSYKVEKLKYINYLTMVGALRSMTIQFPVLVPVTVEVPHHPPGELSLAISLG